MRFRKGGSAGPAGSVGFIVATVVAAAALFGLRVAPTRTFDPFQRSTLDYGRPAGIGFSPLRPDLLAALFGDAPAKTAPAPTGRPSEPAGPPFKDRAAVRQFDHDNFENAATIERIEYTDIAQTRGATRQAGEPSSCARVGGTVWYRYTPPRDLRLTADTRGTDYSIQLGIFEGNSLSNLKQLSCSIGTGGFDTDFTGRAGRTYFVQVGAANASDGGTLTFHLGQRSVTLLESMTDRGTGGNQWSADGSLSRDGRYVLMRSYATNLASGSADEPSSCAGRPAGYPNVAVIHAFSPSCVWRMYLRDRSTGTTELVNRTSSGTAATDAHALFSRSNAVISSDARYVVFSSGSRILDPRNTVGATQIFLRDRRSGTTTRLIPAQGAPSASASSDNAQLSADGRYVFFDSSIDDLVPGDDNDAADVFRLDRVSGRIVRVSLSARGRQLPKASMLQQITPDGRYALILCQSDGVTHPDDNGVADLFVIDMARATVDKISVSSGGAQSNSSVYRPVLGVANGISDDGRFVAFMSAASTLVRGDTNGAADSFVRDRVARTTTRVTVSLTGAQSTNGDRGTRDPFSGDGTIYLDGCSISGDGRYVMVASQADNLVPGDGNNAHDVFVVDRVTHITRIASLRVSDDTVHRGSNGPSFGGAMSSDGQAVLFMTLTADRYGADPGSPGDLYIRVVPRSDRPVKYRW